MWFNRHSSRHVVSSRGYLSRACFPLMERLEERLNFGSFYLNTDQVPPNITDCGCPPSQATVVTSAAGQNGAPTNTTTAPVRAIDGMPHVESTDLLSDGFGKSFGIVRSWTGLNESSQIGNGWMVSGLPYLVMGRNNDSQYHTGRIIVMNSGSRELAFDVNLQTNHAM